MSTKSVLSLLAAVVLCVVASSLTLFKINQARVSWEREKTKGLDHLGASARYELKDFKHGNILGLALLDKGTGRVWLLTTINEKGKKLYDQFEEVGVEELWKTDNEALSDIAAANENIKEWKRQEFFRWVDLKQSTRPKYVLAAEEEHSKKVAYHQAADHKKNEAR